MSGQLADFVAWAIEAFVQKVVQLASLGRQLSGLCEWWQADGKLLTRLTGVWVVWLRRWLKGWGLLLPSRFDQPWCAYSGEKLVINVSPCSQDPFSSQLDVVPLAVRALVVCIPGAGACVIARILPGPGRATGLCRQSAAKPSTGAPLRMKRARVA